MLFQQFDTRYVLRLEAGEPVIQSISQFLGAQKIGFTTVSAAGAVNRVRLGYWDAATQKYQFMEFGQQMEAVSFQGNGSMRDGKPFLHIHGVFGRSDYSVIGGHVAEAWANPTFEVWLRAEDLPVSRVHDEQTGLDLLDLQQRVPSAAGR